MQAKTQAKVCRNCLKLLVPERRERGLVTCADCAKAMANAQQKPSVTDNLTPTAPPSPLQAALKNDLQKQAEAEAQKKELLVKQKNVDTFFTEFQKVKNSH